MHNITVSLALANKALPQSIGLHREFSHTFVGGLAFALLNSSEILHLMGTVQYLPGGSTGYCSIFVGQTSFRMMYS